MRGFQGRTKPVMRGPWRMPFPPPVACPAPRVSDQGTAARVDTRPAAAVDAGPMSGQRLLALLLERPMHGYEMISELDSRTGGVWRPSPGSVYPTLQMLEDEGLIVSEESDGPEAVQPDRSRADRGSGRRRARRRGRSSPTTRSPAGTTSGTRPSAR